MRNITYQKFSVPLISLIGFILGVAFTSPSWAVREPTSEERLGKIGVRTR